ncbi:MULTISPECIES: sensor domain-containing diguanylate cyclase [unclassified Burkholderia]|uniref:sensor domain-containing diguanylate cyclase n=1 Tax=unclassified Burkholderia TaxID=2613784 RepID=UPI000F569575|nr:MULTISPECIES: sensor domain-containing diguanylate cyclase [unclassified Burkholderia]RQR46871.1 sensor domain-containing diguanylate cyclase [Burkholderia sp. Bp9131]RQR79757.1 sensor domain-containing diguanylate cyclase [Burkholderia sp. Bp9015]
MRFRMFTTGTGDTPGSCRAPADDRPALAPLPELDTVCRLARAHFGTAGAFIASAEAGVQRVAASDGTLPATLPAMRFPSRAEPAPAAGRRFITPAGGDLPNDAPHVVAACELVAPDGSALGALCVAGSTGLTLDAAQRAFLHDLATLAERAIGRANAQAALRERLGVVEEHSALTTLALNESGTGVWDRNVETGEIHYSAAWKALLGYAPDELTSRIEDAYERLHPDDVAGVKAAMLAHFESRTDSYAVEHRIRCKNGTYKWICSRGKVIARDSHGRALRMVGTTTDVTALRELAGRLSDSVTLVTSLTDQVPGLVFQLRQTADGRRFFSYASAGARDIYELTPEQIARDADAVETRIHPADLVAYRQSLRVSAERLAPWRLEYRVLLPDQGMRWREGDARPQRTPDGGTVWHGFITDATERKHIETELHRMATTDHLTQLSNRHAFMRHSEAALRGVRATGQDAAVLMLDLDHFKALNDRWGHPLGDRALRHFARLLLAEIGTDGIVGRIGGEEFAIVLPHTGIDAACALALRVQQRVADSRLVHEDQPLVLTVSIGIDAMRTSDFGAYQALSRADKALYVAKERGRNRIEVYRA